jgi:hypothetical protein
MPPHEPASDHEALRDQQTYARTPHRRRELHGVRPLPLTAGVDVDEEPLVVAAQRQSARPRVLAQEKGEQRLCRPPPAGPLGLRDVSVD